MSDTSYEYYLVLCFELFVLQLILMYQLFGALSRLNKMEDKIATYKKRALFMETQLLCLKDQVDNLPGNVIPTLYNQPQTRDTDIWLSR